MSRLPEPGKDNDNWGLILNEFLLQAHNPDGTLRPIEQSRIIGLKKDLDAKADAASSAHTTTAVTTAAATEVSPGIHLYNPYGLRRWSAALGDALLGSATVTVMGDSISVGVGSDGGKTGTKLADPTYRAAGWVSQLRSLFAPTYGDTGEGFIGSLDNGGRITYSGGAGNNYGIGPYKNGSRASSNTQTITNALPICNRIEFWTWDGGSGTASYSVDQGTAVSFKAGTAVTSATTWTQTVITNLNLAAHSLVITGPASGAVYVAGVCAYKQSSGVRVHRLAVSGNTSNNLLGYDANLNGQAAAQARVLSLAAKIPSTDLLLIALGVNDFGGQNNTSPTVVQPGSTPTQYASNIQKVVNQAVSNGACVLLLGEPRQNTANYPTPTTYSEQDYWDQARSIALATDHCAFLDVGELWGTNAQGQTLGLYTDRSVHPTRRGHGSMARLVYTALNIPLGQNVSPDTTATTTGTLA